MTDNINYNTKSDLKPPIQLHLSSTLTIPQIQNPRKMQSYMQPSDQPASHNKNTNRSVRKQ